MCPHIFHSFKRETDAKLHVFPWKYKRQLYILFPELQPLNLYDQPSLLKKSLDKRCRSQTQQN